MRTLLLKKLFLKAWFMGKSWAGSLITLPVLILGLAVGASAEAADMVTINQLFGAEIQHGIFFDDRDRPYVLDARTDQRIMACNQPKGAAGSEKSNKPCIPPVDTSTSTSAFKFYKKEYPGETIKVVDVVTVVRFPGSHCTTYVSAATGDMYTVCFPIPH